MIPNRRNYIPLAFITVFISTQVLANDVDKRRDKFNKGRYIIMCNSF